MNSADDLDVWLAALHLSREQGFARASGLFGTRVFATVTLIYVCLL